MDNETITNILEYVGISYKDKKATPQDILSLSSRLQRYGQQKLQEEEIAKRKKLRTNLTGNRLQMKIQDKFKEVVDIYNNLLDTYQDKLV